MNHTKTEESPHNNRDWTPIRTAALYGVLSAVLLVCFFVFFYEEDEAIEPPAAAIVIPDFDAIRAAAHPHDTRGEFFNHVLDSALELPYVTAGNHGFLAATIDGVTPLPKDKAATPYPVGFTTYGALLITCLAEPERMMNKGAANDHFDYYMTYGFPVRVDQIVLWDTSFSLPEFTQLESGLHNEDGSIPFAKGKQYLVLMIMESDGEDKSPRLELFEHNISHHTTEGITYATPSGDKSIVPWCGITSSLQQMIKENHSDILSLFAHCESRIQSIPVYVTDSLESVVMFHQGAATIVDGEGFVDFPAENDVYSCIISDELADENNLSVGDMLPMQFFPAIYTQSGENGELTHSIWEHYSIFHQGDYVISGLYHRTEKPYAGQMHRADTIFIQRKSIPAFQNEDLRPDYYSPFIPEEAFAFTVPDHMLSDFMDGYAKDGGRYRDLFLAYRSDG